MKEIVYRKNGDYFIPDLQLKSANRSIGKYGRMRLRYLKEQRSPWYYALIASGKLDEDIEETDRRAREFVEVETQRMAERAGIDENLKRVDQMKWVGSMNMIRLQVEEIARKTIIEMKT